MTGIAHDAGGLLTESKWPNIKVLPQDTFVATKQEPAVRYVYLPAGKNDITKSEKNESINPPVKQPETLQVQQTAQTEKPEIQNTITSQITPEDMKLPADTPPLAENNEALTENNIEVEYRGAYYRNMPTEIIEPDRQAHFDNSSITVLYKISDDLSLGADLRQERFYQEFDGLTSDGMPAKYFQQPNFTTLNLLARYSPGEFLGLKPFLQAETGYAKSGWINRAAAGLGFKIAGPLEFVLIGEYSHFLFNNSNNLFTSEKIGFLYGINIKF